MIERAGQTSNFAQQAGIVRFLAEQLKASVRYVPLGDGSTALVRMPDGQVHRFNIYGYHEEA